MTLRDHSTLFCLPRGLYDYPGVYGHRPYTVRVSREEVLTKAVKIGILKLR